jgi:hypothetical protein
MGYIERNLPGPGDLVPEGVVAAEEHVSFTREAVT